MSKPKVEGLSVKQFVDRLRPKREERKDQVYSTKMYEIEHAKASVAGALKVLGLEKFSTLVVDALYHEGLKPKDVDALVKSKLEKKIKEENLKKAEQRKQAEQQWALQQTLPYKFRLIAQLVERKQRVEKLMAWELKDLQEVLKEVVQKPSLGNIPQYMVDEAREDLVFVIQLKESLEPSKDVEETPKEALSLLRKVVDVFRGH